MLGPLGTSLRWGIGGGLSLNESCRTKGNDDEIRSCAAPGGWRVPRGSHQPRKAYSHGPGGDSADAPDRRLAVHPRRRVHDRDHAGRLDGARLRHRRRSDQRPGRDRRDFAALQRVARVHRRDEHRRRIPAVPIACATGSWRPSCWPGSAPLVPGCSRSARATRIRSSHWPPSSSSTWRRSPARGGDRTDADHLALTGLIGLGFVVLMVIGDAGNPGVFGAIGHGGAERMIVYPVMIWLMAFGGYLMAAGPVKPLVSKASGHQAARPPRRRSRDPRARPRPPRPAVRRAAQHLGWGSASFEPSLAAPGTPTELRRPRSRPYARRRSRRCRR